MWRGLKVSIIALAIAAAATVVGVGRAQAGECKGPPEVNKLTVMGDWLPWASQGPIIAAQLDGTYKNAGLEVELISPANPADPIKLVARERVAFSLTYVPEVMFARETGIPVVAVATTLRKLVSGLFYLGDSDIKGPADLKGKILGVGPKQDAQAFLSTLLAAGGLKMEDVKVVDPVFAHIQFVLENKVTAAHGLTYGEGVVANDILVKDGKSAVKWLMYADYGVPNFYYQLLVGSENWIKKNPNATCHFLKATAAGVKSFKDKPDPVIDAMAKANEIFTRDQHRQIVEASVADWTDEKGAVFVQDAGIWSKAQEWAVAQKLITVPVEPTQYFTNDYYEIETLPGFAPYTRGM